MDRPTFFATQPEHGQAVGYWAWYAAPTNVAVGRSDVVLSVSEPVASDVGIPTAAKQPMAGDVIRCSSLVVRRLRYHRRIAERSFTLPGAEPQAALPGPDQHGGSRPSETLIIAAVTHHTADPCSFYTKKRLSRSSGGAVDNRSEQQSLDLMQSSYGVRRAAWSRGPIRDITGWRREAYLP
jgi:hypothetical protein